MRSLPAPHRLALLQLIDGGQAVPETAYTNYMLYLVQHMFGSATPQSFASMFPMLADEKPFSVDMSAIGGYSRG